MEIIVARSKCLILQYCERSELHSFYGILEFCDFSCIDLIIKDDDGWTIL